MDKGKVLVYNYNGVSEWQHLNGFCGNEGNANLHNNSYNDRFGQGANGQGKSSSKEAQVFSGQSFRSEASTDDTSKEYLFRESQNVSHSDTILDMAVLQVGQRDSRQSMVASYAGGSSGFESVGTNEPQPLLITCSRDCTIKLWR